MNPYLLSDVRRHRIAAALGEGRIFATLHEALDAIRAEGAPAGALNCSQSHFFYEGMAFTSSYSKLKTYGTSARGNLTSIR